MNTFALGIEGKITWKILLVHYVVCDPVKAGQILGKEILIAHGERSTLVWRGNTEPVRCVKYSHLPKEKGHT